MKLSQDIDLKKIATDAGLTDDQAEHFARGLEGKHETPLPLARQPYTQLQLMFEKRIMEVLRVTPKLTLSPERTSVDPPFALSTENLCTPIHNPGHPRADIAREMVTSCVPFATMVCNQEGLAEIEGMKHLQEPSVRQRLLSILSHPRYNLLSYNAAGEGTDHSFMATRAITDLAPVKFEASQMPDLQNDEFGNIIFGQEAGKSFEEARILHIENLVAHRNTDFLKQELNF